jgi:hypothetical protein
MGGDESVLGYPMTEQKQWVRVVLGSAAALCVSACAHDNGPPAIQPTPKRPDPTICAPIPPEPEPAGSLVRPITEAEIQGFDRFLDAEIGVRLWGRGLERRAVKAQDILCK